MIIILGDGGHAKVVKAAVIKHHGRVEIHPWDFSLRVNDTVFFGMAMPAHKRELAEKWGDIFSGTVHEAATALLNYPAHGMGLQAMAGSIIQVGCKIGKHVLINTGAQVDHDCVIGDYCHIGPGAILCGNVTLGEDCVIGAGAVVVQGVKLDAGTLIQAGSLVVRQDDIRASQRVIRGD